MGGDSLRERLGALLGQDLDLADAESARSLAEKVVDVARDSGHADVALLLVDPGEEHLDLAAARGAWRGVRPGLRLPLAAPAVACRAVRERRVVAVDDVAAEKSREANGPERGSQLAVPLLAGGRATGVLEAQRPEAAAFTPDDVLLLQVLASHAALTRRVLRVRDELLDEKSRLEAILECSADAIITTDLRGRISFFSRGAEELFGYSAQAVVGAKVSDYYLGGEKEARRVQRYVEEEGKVRNYEAWFKTAAGEPLPASLSASVLRDRAGNVLGSLGILKDITVEKRLERKLSYTIEMLQEANENLGKLAVTDSLSGLKNQRHFHRKLEEEMLRSTRTKRPISLLLIDIDKFKRFNDTYGHQVGDRVIQEMGVTIQASIRKIDHGCRYGGEEFTVILPDTPPENAVVVARRIQAAFAQTTAWAELGIDPPTLSIGLAAYDGSSHDLDTDQMVKLADDAMYRVKRRGGNDLEVDGV